MAGYVTGMDFARDDETYMRTALRLAQNFPPFKRMVAASLSGSH